MQTLGAVIVLVAIVAIFITTPVGQKLAAALGIRRVLAGRARDEDRDYLLRVCSGDASRVAAMLDEARRHNPDMSEAEAYRKAIRAHLRDAD